MRHKKGKTYFFIKDSQDHRGYLFIWTDRYGTQNELGKQILQWFKTEWRPDLVDDGEQFTIEQSCEYYPCYKRMSKTGYIPKEFNGMDDQAWVQGEFISMRDDEDIPCDWLL